MGIAHETISTKLFVGKRVTKIRELHDVMGLFNRCRYAVDPEIYADYSSGRTVRVGEQLKYVDHQDYEQLVTLKGAFWQAEGNWFMAKLRDLIFRCLNDNWTLVATESFFVVETLSGGELLIPYADTKRLSTVSPLEQLALCAGDVD